jgi:hypothetical protein
MSIEINYWMNLHGLAPNLVAEMYKTITQFMKERNDFAD